MPEFLTRARDFLTGNQKDTLPVNRYEGFTANGAIVLRDRRGTSKAEIPDIDLKSETLGSDPLAIYKIPWGVDSDQFWGQTEVANPLNLEATNATRSPLRRTDRYPNQSWRNFRLIGTQPFNLADHVAVAGRRRCRD
jgi:hypothetical protein